MYVCMSRIVLVEDAIFITLYRLSGLPCRATFACVVRGHVALEFIVRQGTREHVVDQLISPGAAFSAIWQPKRNKDTRFNHPPRLRTLKMCFGFRVPRSSTLCRSERRDTGQEVKLEAPKQVQRFALYRWLVLQGTIGSRLGGIGEV